MFAYVFGGDYSEAQWLSTNKLGANSVQVTLDKSPEAVIIVRCKNGTTVGNWDDKWNQTENIEYSVGTTAYNGTLQ